MMNRTRTIIVSVALGCMTRLGIAAPLPVQSAQKDAAGVSIKLQSGLLRLDVCDERTIHVVCSPAVEGPVSKVDFVVNKKWAPTNFDWKEEPTRYLLSTSKVKVSVNRATGAVAFLDADGKTVLQEPVDGGKTLASATNSVFQQTFASPEDEHLYGMAQVQYGVWNWRGMPIELRQFNTQAAFPVLVSSKGYGLLWNNASLTDFNPVDQEIQLTAGVEIPTTNRAVTTPATAATSSQPARGGRGPVTRVERTGTFTTTVAGDYVFFIRDVERRSDVTLTINGKTLPRMQNSWSNFDVSDKISLPARTECSVKMVGGVQNSKLFVRPINATTVFRSHFGDSIDYYYFQGPEIDDVVAAYRNATGAAPLWPKWAYGFWQCRERYSSAKQIVDALAEYRTRKIPVDLMVQDWQYWGNHGWGAYEWDATAYPDPDKMIQSIHDLNGKYMISVWSNPKGKAGDDFKANHFTFPEGNYDWVDAFNPAARNMRWKYLNDVFFKIGTDAWWQDCTEPSDDGMALVGKKVFLGSGDFYRNSYPLFSNQAVYEGQRAATSDKRVVILTRSAFPGQQRYATALWSGDITGDWATFRKQIPAGLNICMAGLPYWTTDCGGFSHPRDQYSSDDYAELLTRWFQFSTFCPVLRVHGMGSQTELWNYPKAQDDLVAYDRLRYRLLPYIYSVAWKVTNDSYTFMRALPMDFRADVKTYDIDDQYMFGPAFLVSPVTEAKATSRKVYLPAAGSWTNFWTGESTIGGKLVDIPAPKQTLPLYIRAGSIIPLGPDLQYATEKPADPIELRVYRGADGSFTLYEDEGDSYRYEKSIFATIPIQWKESNKTLTIGDRTGEFPGMLRQRTFRVVWVRPDRGVGFLPAPAVDAEVRYEGKAISVQAP
jgi:alpha-D-xyloside xylohydrolase